MSELPIDDATALVRAVVSLAQMADRVLPANASPLARRLQEHLGLTDSVPNTSVTFDLIERANLQLALDVLRAEASSWDEIGLNADIGQYGGVSLPTLVGGSFHGPGESSRQFVSVEISATESIRCLRAGIITTRHQGAPVAAMVYTTERHMPTLVVEIAGATQQAADDFLTRIRDLMNANNVLRGKVVSFSFSEYGGFGLGFSTVPSVEREAVILPSEVLEAVEDHALGITTARDELLAAGQHLKRGLLLYGPPGTGKTHTVSYLIGRMTDRTTILLSGASVGALGQAATLARKLAPATIVIEDVDLIGMDRGIPGGEHNPMLFQLLNEMDGMQADDDVLFVLTTNRADLLEPALAARPGRIDQAIEIGLPDLDGRRALFELYLGAPVDDTAMALACERTEGVAAAYIKEAARRATLRSIRHGEPLSSALVTALDELVRYATPVLRASLAAPYGPA
jgi:hypothetical protein